jgi:hypothetical protein
LATRTLSISLRRLASISCRTSPIALRRDGLGLALHIALEFAERIAGEQWVRPAADHLGVLAKRVGARNPRHRAVELRQNVGLAVNWKKCWSLSLTLASFGGVYS